MTAFTNYHTAGPSTLLDIIDSGALTIHYHPLPTYQWPQWLSAKVVNQSISQLISSGKRPGGSNGKFLSATAVRVRLFARRESERHRARDAILNRI